MPQDDVYLKYSGEHGTAPTIGANLSSRVFHHTGSGTLRIVGLTITQGKYGTGGCIYSSGNVYLSASTVTACTATDPSGADATGGGIYAAGSLTMQSSVLSGNTAYSPRITNGGGAFVHGAIGLYYSSVSGNVSSGALAAFGGGVEVVNKSTAVSTIANSTISGNSADSGGGIEISGSGDYGTSITIRNSTISGNIANGYAAAAYFRGPVTLVSTTIAFNTSPSGPGVELASHTDPVTIESSIVAHNGANGAYDMGDRGYALTISGSHDLIVAASSSIALPGDTVGSDPQLLALADNGGSTATHALADGSPAIDAGDNPSGLRFDQRGNPYLRGSGAAPDIGAFERQGSGDTIFADGFDGAGEESAVVERRAVQSRDGFALRDDIRAPVRAH
jgi:hypothetical protein